MNPTEDSRVFQTDWFRDASQPLMEHKIFWYKRDDVLAYTTVSRGPTLDDLAPTHEKPRAVFLRHSDEIECDEYAAFKKLQVFLNQSQWNIEENYPTAVSESSPLPVQQPYKDQQPATNTKEKSSKRGRPRKSPSATSSSSTNTMGESSNTKGKNTAS